MTSHAAVVARGMGKTCVVGAKELDVDPAAGRFRVNGRAVKRGQVITVDGTTGRVILGAAKLVTPKAGKEFHRLMAWADAKRRMRVRANADIPADARRAREFGAEGIGLCRTEHMFFEGDRITLMREMIVAADEAGRRKALAKLLPIQLRDFEGPTRCSAIAAAASASPTPRSPRCRRRRSSKPPAMSRAAARR